MWFLLKRRPLRSYSSLYIMAILTKSHFYSCMVSKLKGTNSYFSIILSHIWWLKREKRIIWHERRIKNLHLISMEIDFITFIYKKLFWEIYSIILPRCISFKERENITAFITFSCCGTYLRIKIFFSR